MARLIRPIRRTVVASSKTLIQQQPSLCIQKPILNPHIQSRTCMSEMRRSAFEGNVLRLLRQEIQFELERSPPKQPATKFGSFVVEERPGEQWIRLRKKFGEKEEIKIEVTMFDGSIPAPKSGGGVDTGEDVELHITFIVNISKGDGGDVLEFMCSAWPDSIDIQKLFMHGRDQTVAQPYTGPEFKELDDELQNSLYEFLERRGINDELAVFLHEYVTNKDKTEFIRWMGSVKSFIEKK
ncbi:hypothetical protein L1049_005225 [Liquidambar formosana]|uniref:Mitochondrial glycoprotein n=1 Tax=Liquidambar formosana TaxID=63359 RepID=A0AAP0WZ27_LIQFO